MRKGPSLRWGARRSSRRQGRQQSRRERRVSWLAAICLLFARIVIINYSKNC